MWLIAILSLALAIYAIYDGSFTKRRLFQLWNILEDKGQITHMDWINKEAQDKNLK
jgi:hypothetical protein